MRIPFYQVDAFTDHPFSGNPAAVCVLDDWLSDNKLQQIAQENNLSETAFLVPTGEGYELRWMTPAVEVELCGHATLAAAWVLFHHYQVSDERIRFLTKFSGELGVERTSKSLQMDFPLLEVEEVSGVPGLDRLKQKVLRCSQADKLILQLEDEHAVQQFPFDKELISRMHPVGVSVTAASSRADVDFVSRFFAPNLGVDEDPVTGSLHCALADFWQSELGKSSLQAEQVSARGGAVGMRIQGKRVWLIGHCVTVIQGQMRIGTM